MIKRTIVISNPAYLSLNKNQMEVRNKDELKGIVPIEDIGVVILENPQITITHGLIRQLQKNNSIIISCDDMHMPYSMMIPLVGHSEQTQSQRWQIQASQALKNNMWKQTIVAKIYNQARVMEIIGKVKQARKLYKLSDKVRMADLVSIEGYASSFYWEHYVPDFRRNQFGDPPNNMLNYGYTILRSMIARSIIGAGLLPTLGIYHRNKYNPFCLADDIMEPFRPFVDLLVLEAIEENPEMAQFLDRDIKNKLLTIMTIDGFFGRKRRPLLVGSAITLASVRKCFQGIRRKIVYPKIPLP